MLLSENKCVFPAVAQPAPEQTGCNVWGEH